MAYLRSLTVHLLRVGSKGLDLAVIICLTAWLYSARKV